MTATRTAPSPTHLLRVAWRSLRTMRTAILLLLLLAAGASVGSLFPQRPIDTAAVNRWIDRNAGWAPLAEKLGLFDVYGAWWFMLIYGLLLVSLVGCLVPRIRAYARALAARPRTSAVLAGQPHYRSGAVGLEPDVALARAERLLRRRRYRLARDGDTVAAEKGFAREGGSLVFHVAFLVVLVGMSMGKWYGFSGQTAVIEGERFTDTRIDYDFIRAGRFFGDRFSGFSLELERFDVGWYPNGVPKQFRSDVKLFAPDGSFVRDESIHVNSPLNTDGLRVHQLSWGWAPHIVVTQDGKTLYDGPTIFLFREGGWRGVVKLPQTKPSQSGLELLFFTDPKVDDAGLPFNASPEPRAPLVFFQRYEGDLRLDVPQSVYELDPTELVPAGNGVVTLGASTELEGGMQVTFRDLKQYSVLQVASNPGMELLFVGAVAILVGLFPALYSSRRRVWVRASATDGVTRLEIAGMAMQRTDAFDEEFGSLVRDIDADLHARTREHVRTGAPDG